MFFEKLAELIGENYTVQIIAKVKSEKLTLTFIPQFDSKEKDVVAKLVPLTITESPSEIDRQIIPIITQAMSKTSTLADALAAYEKGVDAAKKVLDKKDTKKEPVEAKAPVEEQKQIAETPKEDWEKENEKEVASEQKDDNEEETDDVDVNTGEIKQVKEEPVKEEKKEQEMKTSVSMKDLEEMESDETGPEEPVSDTIDEDSIQKPEEKADAGDDW